MIEYIVQNHFSNIPHHQIIIGAENIQWENNPYEAGDNSFTSNPLKSYEDLEEFIFHSNSVESKVKREYLSLVSTKQIGNYVPVQFMTDIVVYSTTYFYKGLVVESVEPRIAKSGDVFWLYVDSNTKSINNNLSIRSDCGNANFIDIRPASSIDLEMYQPIDNPLFSLNFPKDLSLEYQNPKYINSSLITTNHVNPVAIPDHTNMSLPLLTLGLYLLYVQV